MDKGSYVLLIRVAKEAEVKTRGRSFNILPGYYCYIGSAFNSLSERVKRHLKKSKKRFWHIDYLLDIGEVLSVLLLPSSVKSEVKISSLFQKFGEAVDGFGASDCQISSNLYKISEEDYFRAIKSVHEYMGVFG
ncbi:hypothetical protein AT15_07200 [Kosmotoga arenicorallina S304]|uniref:GIY-YIG domain-containing protein n=1 Tax=Kosmotoga arenicorallina S304 TaxID=1453497 RepID=A0A182C722_9BACT|nr:DUF123 domain-containing protein [Kosmotoga arenicorallina]OAA31275.1 hypothetical protein AT15_07200 [Kosmotoga arenicorallina S304]